MSVLENAVEVIGRQHWLDSVAEPVQRGITGAYAAGGAVARRVKGVLHGTWLGHPLHPVLTDVPIGAWTTAVVLDAVAGGRARPGVERAATAAVTLGLAGAVASALTGLTDWQHAGGDARRTGLLHAMLNSAALGLFTTSLVMRRMGARDAGRSAARLGFGVVIVSAYVGGRLVYRDRVGVDHSDPGPRPRDFVPILPDSELREGQLRRVEADGVALVLARRGGRIFALGATCSHLGGPLDEGDLDGDGVRCPWHGSWFALEDGRVLESPAVFPQPCFETRIRDGRIEVRRPDPTPRA